MAGQKQKMHQDDAEFPHLKRLGTTSYLDVGANEGQTGLRLRKGGFRGRIVSFEPISECYEKLEQNAVNDTLWETYNIAIGEAAGPTEIGVSENLVSSSILPATPKLIAIHQPINYKRHETIQVERLDRIWGDLGLEGEVTHLKVDTQGFEKKVLRGARRVLEKITSIRLEVAVFTLYEGEMTVPQAINMMQNLGFLLIDAWPAWHDPKTNEVLYFDLLFRKSH